MRVGKEFLSFAMVGATGFLVDVGVLYLLAPRMGWYVARVLSFLAAATATWLCNRHFTFSDRESGSSLAREYVHYMLTMLVGASVNYAAYVLTLRWLDGPLVPALGVAIGSCAGLAINFLAARHLIFKTVRKR
jgi:putative flippase GtrA